MAAVRPDVRGLMAARDQRDDQPCLIYLHAISLVGVRGASRRGLLAARKGTVFSRQGWTRDSGKCLTGCLAGLGLTSGGAIGRRSAATTAPPTVAMPAVSCTTPHPPTPGQSGAAFYCFCHGSSKSTWHATGGAHVALLLTDTRVT